MDEIMNRIVRCKYCNKPEYYGKFIWLNSHMLCRDCYKAMYEKIYNTRYEWHDLDGKRPTEEDLQMQIAEEFDNSNIVDKLIDRLVGL